jgi:integrase
VRKLAVPEVLRGFLLALADGKQPEKRLFGLHWRDWPRKNVKRICGLAGVAKVTAHGMRGTHATLAVDAGATGRVVAGALGHGSETVTFGSYVAPGTKEAADARAVLTVI